MRVLNVNMTLGSAMGGGIAERTLQMSRALVRHNTRCSILTLDLGITEEKLEALDGIELHALPCLLKRFYLPRFSVRRINDIVKNADIIHLMGHWTFINALVYLFARHHGKPYVVCPAGNFPILGRSKLLKKIYNRLVGIKIVRNANAVIAITEAEKSYAESYGVDTSRIVVVPNGVNGEDYQSRDDDAFRKDYNLGNNPFILFVGRLDYIKGPDLLLEAFNRVKDKFPRHHLVYAGPDERMLKGLRDMAKGFGISERIHFIGHVSGAQKSRAFHAAEFLAIPSRSEAMSIVALEAGITATPVLLTDRCGFDEIDRIGGGRVVPASVDGLQSGLDYLLSDSGRLKTMGANLQKYTREHFIWDNLVDRYTELYRRILGDKNG
jgi:glycosyltransferase involved in cell wall biosynthesis